MSALHCVCGFDPWSVGASPFTAAWHRAHNAHHLATFPDVDQGTKDNLAMFVHLAELREEGP